MIFASLEKSPTDDEECLQDRRRIIQLYGDIRPALNAYLCARGLSHDHSEDIIQETFLRLVRHVADKGTDDNLRGWLFRVARNLSADLHRSERRWYGFDEVSPYPVMRERIDPAPNPEQMILIIERLTSFRTAFAQLSRKQRECLLLRAKGMRYREIAVALGVSVQRVGELMQRAIALSRSTLSKGTIIRNKGVASSHVYQISTKPPAVNSICTELSTAPREKSYIDLD